MNITPEILPIIFAASFFLCVVLVIIGIVLFLRYSARKAAMIDKIQRTSMTTMAAYETHSSSEKTDKGVANRILNFFASVGKRVPASDKAIDYDKLRPKFLQAGIRRENASAIFWGAKLLFIFFLPAGFLFIRLFVPAAPITPTQTIAATVLMAIIGFYIPNLWLRQRIDKRKDMIFKGFPDALDLMVVCVEAGMGLDSAITRVASEMALSNKVLSDEFKTYNLEMRGGKTRRDALKDLAMRTDLQEVNNLVTLLIQTDKFGTSVGQALKVYSDTMRTVRFQRAEEKAAKIPVKLIFPLILFIFPALFVAILGPAAINIYKVFLKTSL